MQTIHTDNAPAAIGPYSQAVRSGNTLYLSGQVALDPATGELVGTTTAAQTTQVLANIDGILTAAGVARSAVVKCSIFLTDINDFATVNGIYGKWFGEHKPARECVQVAGLPRGARVEITVVAESSNLQ